MPARMKTTLLFLIVAAFLVGCGPKKAAAVQVTYIGNSGFLIIAGDKKVLIDALFEGFPPEYTLPTDVQTKLLNAQPPFDHVDLILATHNHADHFNASMVSQYLQANPETVFISTTQATSQLDGFGEQVIAVDPTIGSPVSVEAKGIQVEAIYLSHGQVPAGEQEIYNNAYVVTMDNIKFFHTGDIANLADALPYDLASQKIDLAFIQHFYFQASAKDLIENTVGARYLFPIHYHFTTPAFDVNQIKASFPDAIVFSHELGTWTMP